MGTKNAAPNKKKEDRSSGLREWAKSLTIGILAVLAVHAVLTIRADDAFSRQSIEGNAHRTGNILVKAMDFPEHQRIARINAHRQW